MQRILANNSKEVSMQLFKDILENKNISIKEYLSKGADPHMKFWVKYKGLREEMSAYDLAIIMKNTSLFNQFEQSSINIASILELSKTLNSKLATSPLISIDSLITISGGLLSLIVEVLFISFFDRVVKISFW